MTNSLDKKNLSVSPPSGSETNKSGSQLKFNTKKEPAKIENKEVLLLITNLTKFLSRGR